MARAVHKFRTFEFHKAEARRAECSIQLGELTLERPRAARAGKNLEEIDAALRRGRINEKFFLVEAQAATREMNDSKVTVDQFESKMKVLDAQLDNHEHGDRIRSEAPPRL